MRMNRKFVLRAVANGELKCVKRVDRQTPLT